MNSLPSEIVRCIYNTTDTIGLKQKMLCASSTLVNTNEEERYFISCFKRQFRDTCDTENEDAILISLCDKKNSIRDLFTEAVMLQNTVLLDLFMKCATEDTIYFEIYESMSLGYVEELSWIVRSAKNIRKIIDIMNICAMEHASSEAYGWDPEDNNRPQHTAIVSFPEIIDLRRVCEVAKNNLEDKVTLDIYKRALARYEEYQDMLMGCTDQED